MRIVKWIGFLCCASVAFAQLNVMKPVPDYKGSAKEKAMILSWGDLVGDKRFEGVARVDTPENAQAAANMWKARGVNKVIFRVDDFRIRRYHRNIDQYAEWAKATLSAWDSGVLPAAIDAVRKEGMEIFAWLTIFDEGCPAEMLYSDSVPFHWQSDFTKMNPQFLSCDRSITTSGRKYHWGVLEYAYPEARQYMLKEIRRFSDNFNFTGMFLSVRTHTPPPDFADQFGYNEPIVNEYKRRYGLDILRQSFDLEKWRDLRGEYLTTFLQEVKAHLKTKGQKLSIGVAQGEHIGPPFGNMTLQWRRWISENIVDEIVIGHHTNERHTYPFRIQREAGYVQHQDIGVGLPPIEQALAENYGPLCRKHNVKLYLDIPLGQFYSVYADPTFGQAQIKSLEKDQRLLERLEKIQDLTGIVVDGRPLSLPETSQPGPGRN